MKTVLISSDKKSTSLLAGMFRNNGRELVSIESPKEAHTSVFTGDTQCLAIHFDPGKTSEYEIKQYNLAYSRGIKVVVFYFSEHDDLVRQVFSPVLASFLEVPNALEELAEFFSQTLLGAKVAEREAISGHGLCFEDGRVMIGKSQEILNVYHSINKLAKVDTSVLISGESGTGKELVARALHYNSKRKHGPFVALNCATLPDTLIESELFGHDKGAYTGADRKKIGKFQFAEGGTLFLDEIGDISAPLQVKLLRVLQEKCFTPVGSNHELKTDVRILAATNRSLERMVSEGAFRADLFYRLNILPLLVPPLRNRYEDIELLVDFFIQQFNKRHQRRIQRIDRCALKILRAHSWPGNVRELENVIEHAFIIESSDCISLGSLPPQFSKQSQSGNKNPQGSDGSNQISKNLNHQPNDDLDLNYHASKEKFEREFLSRALQAFDGRINKTAAHTKMTKVTLLRKLEKYKIDPRAFYPS